MTRCIVFGHEYQRFPGVGDHEGKWFMVCVICNKTIPAPE